MVFKITSNSFKDGEMIPDKYTCEGDNISPNLKWDNLPEGTKSLSLIMEDVDSIIGIWVHWILFNIPADQKELQEDIPRDKVLANGSMQGVTNFESTGYGGPCPRIGTHRYYFRFFALDSVLDIEPGATKEQLLKEMEGHVIATSELMGRYRKK